MMILITYDVSTADPGGAKRLRRVARLCQDRGQRVQKSVFECLLDPAQWVALRAKLADAIDPERDSLRFYYLGAKWQGRVEHLGHQTALDPEGPLIL